MFDRKIKTEILIRAYFYLPKKYILFHGHVISINKNSNPQGH